jgi:hypothetical protein
VKRLGQLGFLAGALERGELGYEAARLVAGVATPRTVKTWVARAKERTLRHLREEIDAAELLSRWSERSTVVPPSDEDVRRVEELERAVVAGRISPPPAAPLPATVTLRLRVRASTASDFRHWEAIYLRHRGVALRNTTFLRFACERRRLGREPDQLVHPKKRPRSLGTLGRGLGSKLRFASAGKSSSLRTEDGRSDYTNSFLRQTWRLRVSRRSRTSWHATCCHVGHGHATLRFRNADDEPALGVRRGRRLFDDAGAHDGGARAVPGLLSL